MGIYRVVGDAIIKEQDYFEALDSGALEKLAQKARGDRSATIDLSGRTVSVREALEPRDQKGTPFVPIRKGDPLTIEIRWVYTGNKPGRGKRDMIITSSFKSHATHNEAARAVNLVRQKVSTRSNIVWSAVDKGAPLCYYIPAVVDAVTEATFELAFDTFPDDVIEQVGNFCTQAAGIPLFAAQSMYLVAAGSVLKLAAKIGHKLFDGKAVYRFTEKIAFEHPGSETATAGWKILTQETNEDDFLQELKVGRNGQLMTSDGKPYEGEFPYVVISLDGRKNDSYKEFAPTAASAVLIDKFFGIQDNEAKIMDNVLEGLKLYNDLEFRHQAEKLKKELDKMKPGDPCYDEKKKELEAFKANINCDELKIS